MSNSEDDKNDVKSANFEEHRSRFFAMIGLCITRYQAVEDYLFRIFAAALGIDEPKAFKLSNMALRLDIKLSMITIALSDASDEHRFRWENLCEYIHKASEARNKIAHANPAHGTPVVPEMIETEHGPRIVSLQRVGPDHMGLYKFGKKRGQITIWTIDLLTAEYERIDKLFNHVDAFAMCLKGQEVPADLEELEPVSPKAKKKPRRRGKRN